LASTVSKRTAGSRSPRQKSAPTRPRAATTPAAQSHFFLRLDSRRARVRSPSRSSLSEVRAFMLGNLGRPPAVSPPIRRQRTRPPDAFFPSKSPLDERVPPKRADIPP